MSGQDSPSVAILERLEASRRRMCTVLGIEYDKATGTVMLLNAAATYIESGRTDRSIQGVMGADR